MNKDVVYIEPEEDITDVISKINSSKSKIVALVPPKKAGVFRSIVNIKLIAKTASNAEKTVVLVTTDASIMKLAAATKVPVTKDLKSAPKVPELEEVEEINGSEVVDVDDEANDEGEVKNDKRDSEDKEDEGSSDDIDDKDEQEEDNEEENDDEGHKDDDEKVRTKKDSNEVSKKPKVSKLANSNNPVFKWIGMHKKLTAGIGVVLVILIIFMIWAFGIAPAVTITLKLDTVKSNFSENVSFTDKLTDENVTEGKFYVEEKKLEAKKELEFEATGKKNVGEKAKGDLTVSYYFPVSGSGGTIAIKNGTVFTNAGKNYLASADASIRWDGDVTSAAKDCENFKKDDPSWKTPGCKVSTKVLVTASDSGTGYNINANSNGWSTSISGVSITGNSAISGGSDKEVIVVQQSDIEKAMNALNTESGQKDEIKKELLSNLPDDKFAIDSSFKLETADPVSSPEVGKEVEEGKKAKLTVTTTATIFIIDETKLKEFITEKAKLEKGYKIYEMNNPFVENFTKTDAGYVGKLKTAYVAGSTVTENEVVDIVKGKGIGTAKRDISDKFDGIKTIDISTSVPWVTAVPGNPDKITIVIEADSKKAEE